MSAALVEVAPVAWAPLAAISGFCLGWIGGRAWEIVRTNRSIRALRRRSPYLANQLDAVAMEASRIMTRHDPEGRR